MKLIPQKLAVGLYRMVKIL